MHVPPGILRLDECERLVFALTYPNHFLPRPAPCQKYVWLRTADPAVTVRVLRRENSPSPTGVSVATRT